MGDYSPRPDWNKISAEAAHKLLLLQRALTRHDVFAYRARDDKTWAMRHMQLKAAVRQQERVIVEECWVVAWTVHVAGAPGFDEEFSCDEQDCDNPWCGQVQKCSRCHDVLCFGFSAPGAMADILSEIFTGQAHQKVMESQFGLNPVDEDGPTWFPVGMEVAKRPQPPGQAICPVADGEPKLESGEEMKNCEIRHSAIEAEMRSE